MSLLAWQTIYTVTRTLLEYVSFCLSRFYWLQCILPIVFCRLSRITLLTILWMLMSVCLLVIHSISSEKETLCILLMFWSMPPLHYQSNKKFWSAIGDVFNNEPVICKTLIGRKHVIHFYTHEWAQTTELQISVNCTRATPTTVYPIKSILL